MARATVKQGLRLAIGLLAVAAPVTGATRVAGINRDDQHASQSRLILHETSKLGKTPPALPVALATANRDPRTNPFQIFQGNPALRVLSRGDERFTDAVVLVSSKAGLPSRQRQQFLFGPARLTALEPLPISEVSAPDSLDCRATVVPAVAVGRQVHDAQVDAEKVIGFDGRCLWKIDRGVEIKRAVAQHEIDLPLDSIEPLTLVGPIQQADAFPAAERQNAHDRWPFEAQDALVVGHRSVRPEGRARRPVTLKTLDGLPDGADGHLTRQGEPLAQLVIGAGVDRRLTKYACIKADPCGVRRCGIELAHRRAQDDRLLRRWHQAQLQCQFHRDQYRSIPLLTQEGARLLTMPEGRGFRRANIS